ncbi:MAG: hypothetical protein COT74_00915 [Bdellovibrionales bacterium CG10_big_fil_rev_8_21_14_0_10_45_34]|nr:MAG: hypothetical protein COT74_00915 [Bdellovibrionales bacterium CG10_big_fil_rev_8_21_14_0_10_45_34]
MNGVVKRSKAVTVDLKKAALESFTKLTWLKLMSVAALFFFVTTSGWAQAKVTVESHVEPSEGIAVGDFVRYTVEVNVEGGSVNIQSVDIGETSGFLKRSQSTSVQSRHELINGQIQTSVLRSYTFILVADKDGTFTLPPAKVTTEEGVLETNPVKLLVAKSSGRSGGGSQAPQQARPNRQNPFGSDPFTNDPFFEDLDDLYSKMLRRRGVAPPAAPPKNFNPNEAFFIKLEVDKESAYAGEQLTASWYLYTKSNIVNIDTLKYPDLKGFWKEDIEVATKLNFESVIVGGLQYQRALLVSYALFPLKPGVAVIDPYRAKCTVSSGGVFTFGQLLELTKTSEIKKIQVKDLPSPVPVDFTGAVGEFSVSSEITAQTLRVGEPFPLKVKVEGKGNAKQVSLPALNLPQTVEKYDQTEDSKFYKDGRSYKEVEVLLIPRVEGELKIPAMSFSFFDPNRQQYETKMTNEFVVQIGPAQAGSQFPSQRLAIDGSDTQRPADFLVAGGYSSLPGWLSLMRDHYYWLSLSVVSLLSVLAMFLRFSSSRRKVPQLHKQVASRVKKLEALLKQEDLTKLGAEGVNSIYWLLSQFKDEASASSFDDLISQLPPSMKTLAHTELRAIFEEFEALTFRRENNGAEKGTDRASDRGTEKAVHKGMPQDYKKSLRELITKYEKIAHELLS